MRGLLATARNAVAEALSNRAAMVSQMTVMIVNDLVWVAFWLLFFRRVGHVRGWNGEHRGVRRGHALDLRLRDGRRRRERRGAQR